MGIPSKAELEMALTEAGRMRETSEDPKFVAKSLLNHHYQLTHLENLYHAVQHYIHSGHEEVAHSKLLVAIERYRSIVGSSEINL